MPVHYFNSICLIGKGPQIFSTVFTRIAGDFGLVAQNPLTESGLLFMILPSSAVPVWDLIKTRIIKLFERKHGLRIYRPVIKKLILYFEQTFDISKITKHAFVIQNSVFYSNVNSPEVVFLRLKFRPIFFLILASKNTIILSWLL